MALGGPPVAGGVGAAPGSLWRFWRHLGLVPVVPLWKLNVAGPAVLTCWKRLVWPGSSELGWV